MNAGAGHGPFRRRSFYPGLLLILFLIGAATAVWDYFRVDAITRSLAMREVRGLIYQVEREIGNAAQGERTVRSYLDDHLLGAAWLIARLEQGNLLFDNTWDLTAAEAGVLAIDIVNEKGVRTGGTSEGVDLEQVGIDEILEELSWAEHGELRLGGVSSSDGNGRLYTAAVARQGGGAILVSLDEAELMHYRSQVGLGSILEHLSGHPEVHFAVISSGGTILAATTGLPDWVGGPGDSFGNLENISDNETTAQFTETPDGEAVFEAKTRLTGLTDVTLRLALRADELRSIRSNSLFALTLRTVLIILLGGLTLAFLVARQNQRLLAAETDRIRSEVERLEADRTASERLEAMGKLAGGIAHEIRNPLNTVEMVAQRLELEFETVDDRDEYLALVGTMRSEAKRIGKIVQDFLAFARPPSTNKQVGSLGDVIDRTVTLFRPMAENMGVEVTVQPGEIKPFAFDHEQIGQALQNLLRNALEAVPGEGGSIGIATHAEGKMVRIDVVDNGPGIPVQERTRVFHLYHTTKAGGTGVGLSLVHRIADEHGGRVEISDTPGGGATLRLWLKREAR